MFLDKIALALSIIGGLNWGCIGLFNPGTAGGVHARAGYGVILVKQGKFRTQLK